MPGELLAVDGTGLLVRCSRAAAPRHAVTSPAGAPAAVVTVFVGALARKLRYTQPGHLVITWDGEDAGAWRRALYPDYKGGRVPCGQGFPQRAARDFCEAAGMCQLSLEGYEADDMLAAVTRAAARDLPGSQTLVCTDDSDLLQLAGSQVSITGLTTGEITDAAGVGHQWGVQPRWLPHLRALAGDPSDGIPGLPGVGVKKAAKMLREAGMTWPLPEHVLPPGVWRRKAGVWHEIMDLSLARRAPEREPGWAMTALGGSSRWDPGSTGNVQAFLDMYGMTSISGRLERGVLW